MSDNFVKHALENGGSIHPLLVPSDYLNGPSITNPSIYNDDGKILVNLRNINYTLYHSEKKIFEHHWGPLVYIHPENDQHLRTWNYMCEVDDNMRIKRYNKIKNEDDNDAVVLINPYTNKGMLYRTGLSGAIFAPILFIIFILAGIYLLYAYKEDKNNAM